MINRLRRNIILVNMLLVGSVILMIFTVVCVNSYSNSLSELEHGLMRVTEKDRRMDIDDIINNNNANQNESQSQNGSQNNNDQNNNNNGPDKEFRDIGKPDFKGESPMEITSYIVAQVDSNGKVTEKTENNVTIDDDTLQACVTQILSDDRRSGQLDAYGLMYVKNESFNQTTIALASNNSVWEGLRNTVFISAGLFVGSMVIIFLISLALSGLAVKPVKKAWEQQKQFVADASHELKTPLTVILANNNIMLSHTEASVADERQWLESTEEEAQHMKQLIDQMLFLAKSDAGSQNMEYSEVDISDIAEGASLNFEPVAFEKNVTLDYDITPSVSLIGNGTQLNQLAHILIDNAVKYADEGSTVTISLTEKNDSVRFSVNNHGNVIAKEDIEHIFDRFYRAEKSRTTKGYGLGLSIAQRIVQDMSGKLTVASNETDGTTFTAVFPKKS